MEGMRDKVDSSINQEEADYGARICRSRNGTTYADCRRADDRRSNLRHRQSIDRSSMNWKAEMNVHVEVNVLLRRTHMSSTKE